MARKEAVITITEPGRDQGKRFILREMSTMQSERWAARAISGLARSGVQVPDDMAGLDLLAIAALGFKALASMSFTEAEPLMREMMGCIRVLPNTSDNNVERSLVDNGTDGDDIEEMSTRLRLRKEVFALHVDFSSAVGVSISALTATLRTALTSMSAQTSPEQ